jgi:hypothetical protein
MDEDTFKRRMAMAQQFAELTNADYYRGYMRGLRRLHHGESFGTEAEHIQWFELSGDRADLGRGYRDGFEGREPEIEAQELE